MTTIETLGKSINDFEGRITLKADYSEELETLDTFESDVRVFQHLNAPIWKCRDLLNQIKGIRAWINEETH